MVDGRPGPRGCGADVTSLELEPSIRQDSTANPIPESNSRKISNFCGAGQELAWRVSDRTDHSRASAGGPVPERSVVPKRPAWSYLSRIATFLLVGGPRDRPLFFYFRICCEAVAENKNQAEASAGTLPPQNPRALGVGRRSRGEQDERDEQWRSACELSVDS
jgi:hypothetical protein